MSPELHYNVYDTPPTGAIVTPAVVIRPDNPWVEQDPETFRSWITRYLAVCVVNASSSPDAVAELYDMILAIKASVDLTSDWAFDGAGGIVSTEQAGITYLAAAVRLTYRVEL